MRYTEYYNQPSPELGETADITVVTNAILAGEKNQSGKIEFLKATYSGNTISLTSESRTSKNKKYYNGMSVVFFAPTNLTQSDVAVQLKVDDLQPQPFKVKTSVLKNEIVIASFDSTNGFVSKNMPIPRSSSLSSSSEDTVATSKAVNDLKKEVDTKYDNSGGTISGNAVITGNEIVNGSISCNSLILNGYTITIE